MDTVEMRHAAIVKISTKLLLEMLDFKGGIVHRVYMEDPYLLPDYFCIVLEHPDLKPVPENQMLPSVTPLMQVHYAAEGGVTKIERIEPPKNIVVIDVGSSGSSDQQVLWK